jgi:hypothetical protein
VSSISEVRFYSSSFHSYIVAPFLSLSPCPHCLASRIPAPPFISSLNHLILVYHIPAPLFVSYFFTVTLMSPIPSPFLDSSVYHSQRCCLFPVLLFISSLHYVWVATSCSSDLIGSFTSKTTNLLPQHPLYNNGPIWCHALFLQMGLMDCSETSTNIYIPMLCNIPEEQKPHLHRDGSLISCIHFAESLNIAFNFWQSQGVKKSLELLWTKRPFTPFTRPFIFAPLSYPWHP